MKHFFSLLEWPKTIFSALAVFSIISSVQAEGSKNLTPGTGNRGIATSSNNYVGYLQHDDGANSNDFLKANSPANQRLYIRVKANETLYYGVRRVRSNGNDNGNLRLQIKYTLANGTEAVGNSNVLTAQAQATAELPNLAAGQVGVIATPEQAAAGPRYPNGGPAAGYSPLSYTNTTGADRDFWVEFMEVETVVVTPARGNKPAVTEIQPTATQSKAWYDCWDFTVRDAAGEKPGRLYSQQWSFTAAGGTNQLSDNFALYTLIPNPNFNDADFFIKRVSYAGLQPFGVMLMANKLGTTAPGDFKEKRKSRITNLGYPEYKLFVNDPDITIYPTTTRPGIPTVTTSCNNTNNTTTFTLNVDQAGFGLVFIDGDSNGAYDPTKDRVLEQNTVIGNNTFVWNGNSDSGAKITATTLSVTFSSGVGPANFPIWDCEQAPSKGISVQDVRPGTNGAADYIFWDNSLLDADFSTPLINPVGSNTEAGSHKWGTNKGDNRLVNSYAVGLLARGNSIQITYDPTTVCATAPVIKLQVPLPVELSGFTVRLQDMSVQVKWETASERDCAYFVVERSTDGQTFAALGQVAGNGTTNSRRRYAFIDEAPLPGLAYYRLRQVDNDGAVHHSPIVAVKSLMQVTQAVLYPNPATTAVTVRFAEAIQGPVQMRIVDTAGRVLWTQQRSLEQHTTLLKVPTAQLPTSSLYMLQVVGNGFSGTYRFIK